MIVMGGVLFVLQHPALCAEKQCVKRLVFFKSFILKLAEKMTLYSFYYCAEITYVVQ